MPSPGWDFYFPSMCFLQSSVADSCCFKLYFMKHVRSSSSPFSTFYHSSNLSLMAIATNPCGLLSGKDLCEARQIWEEYQSVLNSFVEIILFHRFSEKKKEILPSWKLNKAISPKVGYRFVHDLHSIFVEYLLYARHLSRP